MTHKAILTHSVTGEQKLVAPADVWRHRSSGWNRTGTKEITAAEVFAGVPEEVTGWLKDLEELQAAAPTMKRHETILTLEQWLEEAGFPVEAPTEAMDEDSVKAARKAFDAAKQAAEGGGQ